MKSETQFVTSLMLTTLFVAGCSKPADKSAEIGEVRGNAIVIAEPPAAEPEQVETIDAATVKIEAVETVQVAVDAVPTKVAEPVEEVVSAEVMKPVEVAEDATALGMMRKLPVVAPEDEEELPKGYERVGFDHLAGFEYDMPEEWAFIRVGTEPPPRPAGAVIPDFITKLDSQTIGLRGFMLPLKVEDGLVTELLLMRDQSMCCYGTQPEINEWVSVKMKDEGVKPVMDEPVTLLGTLKVGEFRENGYLVGIYEMEGHSLN